jgi:hypothetical protein
MTVEAAMGVMELGRVLNGWLTRKLGKTPHHPYEDFNKALNFALDYTDEGIEFLRAWREGSWALLDREWPEWRDFVALDEYSYINLRNRGGIHRG